MNRLPIRSIFLGVMLLSVPCFGQKSHFHIGLSAGLGYTLQTPRAAPLVRPLLGFPRFGGAFSMEGHYQGKNRWGVGILVRIIDPPRFLDSRFSQALAQEFPEDYADIHLSRVNLSSSGELEATNQGFGFVSYTFLHKKWALQPRFLLGITSFPVVSATVVLKRHNTNQLSILSLAKTTSAPNNYYEKTTLGLSIVLERNISKRWSLFAGADWTSFYSTLQYTQTIDNQVDGSIVSTILENPSLAHLVHFSAGILYRWDKGKKKREAL